MALLFPQFTSSIAHLPYPNKGNHFLVCGGQMRLGHFSKKGNNLIRCESVPTKSVNLKTSNIFNDDYEISRQDFPPDFKFGASTSAIQSEGPPTLDGRGPSNWDSLIGDKAAALSYYKYKEDVKLLHDMGMDVYRFSISWSRIMPNGRKGEHEEGINQEGVNFYNNLLDELKNNGIEPFVTLCHFEIPETLQNEYGGFLKKEIVNDFKNYCDFCFEKFGDKVKYWATINEPDVYMQYGYFKGLVRDDNPAKNPYTVAHNIIMAHANVYDLYKDKYEATQHGKIGMSLSLIWFVPFSHSTEDKHAAERGVDFHTGLFLHPLVYGKYPANIIKEVGDRLTPFKEKEVIGRYDYVGINYYTSQYAKALPKCPHDKPIGFTKDQYLEATADKDGIPLGENVVDDIYMVPEGLKEGLIYLKERYKNPLIYITENGVNDASSSSVTFDNHRINYIVHHFKAILEAIKEGVQVKGYMYWSLMDVVEMGGGNNIRLGLNHTNFDNWDRIPKNSSIWFKNFLKPHLPMKPIVVNPGIGTVQV